MKKFIIIMSMLLASVANLMAQEDPMYMWEIGVSGGLMTYQGDFNGKLFSGKNSAPTASIMLRRVFNPYTNLRFDLGYGQLKGNSADVDTYYPHFNTKTHTSANNSYSFKNSVIDLSTTFEYNFWPYGTGRDYRGAKRFTPYIYIGLGLTYAKCKNGWADLSQVKIDSIAGEQVFSDSIATNNKGVFTACFITGFGIKYKIAPRVNLGLEWGMHFSFSDKLDGVKDPYTIASSGIFKNTDCFSVLKASVTYSFGPKCRTCMNQDWHY